MAREKDLTFVKGELESSKLELKRLAQENDEKLAEQAEESMGYTRKLEDLHQRNEVRHNLAPLPHLLISKCRSFLQMF